MRPHTVRILAAGAAAALAALALAPAQAATAHYEATMLQDLDASTTTAGCTLTGEAPVHASDSWAGSTLTRTSTVHRVVTKDSDDTDTTTYDGTTTSSLSLDESPSGRIVAGTFEASYSSVLTSALGASSACAMDGATQALVGVEFETSRDGWLTVHAAKTAGGGAGVQLTAETDGPSVMSIDLDRGFKTTSTRTYFLPAGPYVLQAVSRAPVRSSSDSSRLLQNAGHLAVDFALVDAGTATGPATGAGRTYLRLPSVRTCSDLTLTATWRGAARTVSLARFFVGQDNLLSVRNPKPGAKVVLRSLPDDRDAVVWVALVLDADHGERPAEASVSRTYLPCA